MSVYIVCVRWVVSYSLVFNLGLTSMASPVLFCARYMVKTKAMVRQGLLSHEGLQADAFMTSPVSICVRYKQ